MLQSNTVLQKNQELDGDGFNVNWVQRQDFTLGA